MHIVKFRFIMEHLCTFCCCNSNRMENWMKAITIVCEMENMELNFMRKHCFRCLNNFHQLQFCLFRIVFRSFVRVLNNINRHLNSNSNFSRTFQQESSLKNFSTFYHHFSLIFPTKIFNWICRQKIRKLLPGNSIIQFGLRAWIKIQKSFSSFHFEVEQKPGLDVVTF